MAELGRTSPRDHRHGELRLHVWAISDVGDLGEYWSRNRDHLSPTQPHRSAAFWTEEGQRRRVENAAPEVAAGRTYPFLVTEDGRMVAEVALSDVTRGAFQSCHIGYSVDGDRLRRGIATWAVLAAVDVAFDDLGLHRVQAATLVDNVASQHVLRGCGFERIGEAAQYLAIAGSWADHILWQRTNSASPPPLPA